MSMPLGYPTQFDWEYRDLYTGVNPMYADPEWADGALDAPGTPATPIVTRLEGPYGLPWIEGFEDVDAAHGLQLSSPNPRPWSEFEDVGAEPIVGAYEGAFRTSGPVTAFSHEPSGGWYGDQNIGRIMRFPANKPERYDPYGVYVTPDRDDLAASVWNNDLPIMTDADVTTSLLDWPNVYGRW